MPRRCFRSACRCQTIRGWRNDASGFSPNRPRATRSASGPRELGLSRRTFTRLFRRETGLTFSAWQRRACLLQAMPRLIGGERVTTIAYDLGYSSPAAFTVMFKQLMGTFAECLSQRDGGAVARRLTAFARWRGIVLTSKVPKH